MTIYPATPVLADAFIIDFNNQIKLWLPWLDNTYGKIQEITRYYNDSPVKVPAIHLDSGEYFEVLPDDTNTNYSWFDLGNEELTGIRQKVKVKTTGKYNLFVNLNQIYPTVTESRDLENVKQEVYQAITKLSIKSGSVRIKSVSEKYDDVYNGFKILNLDDKYFMQPFAGLSFDLDIYLRNTELTCSI